MTELVFKNNINDVQMSILLNLLKSWNVEAEIKNISVKDSNNNCKNVDLLQRIKKIDQIFDNYLIDLSDFKFNRDEANDYD
jgi:galactitol-specific phosphotransferase system IIB component